MNGPARKSPDSEDFGLIHSDGDDLQVAKKRKGVGATRRVTAVRWGIAGNILWAWVLTIPISALISAAVHLLIG